MRRTEAFKRSRVIPLVVAGFAGYVLGGWNGALLHSTALSAAQTVALRFPQDADDVVPAPAALASTMPATTLGTQQVALLSPQPMVQAPAPQQASTAALAQEASAPWPAQPASAPVPSVEPANVQMASAEEAPVALPQPAVRPAPIKPAAVRRLNERPGFVLNDSQIASIKERLHLTPDQEQMWPAVEAALRNLAYERARQAHRRGTAATLQVASADPNSADVQDLKSAAIPLIMSFNSEQKDEVRSIAHVMGLDQLANQF